MKKHALFGILLLTFSAAQLSARTDASAPVSASPSGGGGGNCGEIKADCKTHKIKVKEKEATINCGKGGTTITGKGQVGGPHKGAVVPDGVDIKTPRMGQAGGGKVFHTPNPKAMSGTPTGTDSTKGCIAVDLETLNLLKSCQGSTLDIVGNDNGGGATQQMASSSGSGRAPASSSGRGSSR